MTTSQQTPNNEPVGGAPRSITEVTFPLSETGNYSPSPVPSKEPWVDIVFDGPPSHEAGRFVEVEDESGKSIKFGEWVERPDGYWALRFSTRETEIAEDKAYVKTLEEELLELGRELEGTQAERNVAVANFDDLSAELAKVKGELEIERLRVAGLGVVAMSNTPESAKQNRITRDNPIWCASFGDVEHIVDSEMALRAERDGLRGGLELVLPLAKGYAAEHPVGSNAEYVEQAAALLH